MTRHILVVDDKEENLYYLEALLTGHGFEVSTARHGAEALSVARKRPPDVVVSDLLMPVMDGYTLLRHWRGDQQLGSVPFIVYTATYTEPEDEKLALDLGADAFILKPAEPEDFLRQLAALRSHKARDGSAGSVLSSGIKETLRPEMFKAYSDTLIRKLEEKMLQLEKANAALKADIEERERVEEALRRSQRLEVVGSLTGGIAHDFNNFLQVIQMNIDLMNELGSLPQAAGESIASISHAVESATELVRSLLAFAGCQSLQPVLSDVNELIERTSRLLLLVLGKSIIVRKALAADIGSVLVDQGQLESALMNLCVNARDAMPDGGALLIETHDVSLASSLDHDVDTVPAGEYVQIRIVDTGIGIEEAHLGRVFEPFFTTKSEGGGTGLGLSMVYGFIKQSRGGITIDSVPGEGTVVSLYLPR